MIRYEKELKSYLTIYAKDSSLDGDGIGILKINTVDYEGCARIVTFQVCEPYRERHIGKKLLKSAIKELKNTYKLDKLIVSPSPDPIGEEEPLDIETLYYIYEHLGFMFKDQGCDRSKYRNLMIMNI